MLDEVFRCWSSTLCVGGSVKMLEQCSLCWRKCLDVGALVRSVLDEAFRC